MSIKLPLKLALLLWSRYIVIISWVSDGCNAMNIMETPAAAGATWSNNNNVRKQGHRSCACMPSLIRSSPLPGQREIKSIANNYNYLFHTFFLSIKHSNIYLKIHIYHYLIVIDFILHHTSMCVWYIFNWTICLWIGILISSIIHEYVVTHIVGRMFI